MTGNNRAAENVGHITLVHDAVSPVKDHDGNEVTIDAAEKLSAFPEIALPPHSSTAYPELMLPDIHGANKLQKSRTF